MKTDDVEQAALPISPLTTNITTTQETNGNNSNEKNENKTIKEKLDEAKENNSGVGLLLAWFVIFIGKVGCDILSAITTCIPIAMICMGAIHLKDCPACNFIPIYLLVGGIIQILNQFMNWMKCRNKIKEKDSVVKSKFTHFFDLFLFIWFITGSVYVYKTYKPNYIDNTLDDYCDKATYLFAFWLITSVYILIGTILVVGCCCCIICGCFYSATEEK